MALNFQRATFAVPARERWDIMNSLTGCGGEDLAAEVFSSIKWRKVYRQSPNSLMIASLS